MIRVQSLRLFITPARLRSMPSYDPPHLIPFPSQDTLDATLHCGDEIKNNPPCIADEKIFPAASAAVFVLKLFE
jgi:hypothetical protein